jgi:3-hydroxyacyl-CoA dehydrogenase/3a,7a,12a-trihydroxy-5b-cholest-24-enoyl-CoA hydratase
MNLDGRVIIVGGATGCLGSACAEELARLGARLVVQDRHAAEDLVAEAMARFGRLDAVVAAELGDARGHSSDDEVLTRHLGGTIALASAALAVMDRNDTGRIVGVGSGAGAFGSARYPLHAAAAAGVTGYVRSLSLALRDTRIRANVISPVFGTSPVVDACSARSMAPAVAYLCHPDCQLKGDIWSVGRGRFATIFSGTTAGYFEPEPDIDAIAANLDVIRATDHPVFPTQAEDERLLIDV